MHNETGIDQYGSGVSFWSSILHCLIRELHSFSPKQCSSGLTVTVLLLTGFVATQL
uniref:Uncharacterized protein n=1 Tax=Anguilla anguilla TaxID=7936 RepID=A0A0E9XBI9_ANGAN